VLKLVSALVAGSLLLSPALAKPCIKADQVAKKFSDNVIKRFDGPEAMTFLDKLRGQEDDDSPNKVPDSATSVIVFKPQGSLYPFTIFVGGCFKGQGILSKKVAAKVLDDDGSI
jgi:hypothetical protein